VNTSTTMRLSYDRAFPSCSLYPLFPVYIIYIGVGSPGIAHVKPILLFSKESCCLCIMGVHITISLAWPYGHVMHYHFKYVAFIKDSDFNIFAVWHDYSTGSMKIGWHTGDFLSNAAVRSSTS
jgi:hypothetical protein